MVSFEMPGGETLRRLDGLQTEARERERMPGNVHDRSKDFGNQLAGSADQRSKHACVCARVWSKRCTCALDGMFENGGRSVIHRMRDRRRRQYPFVPMLRKWKSIEEWGGQSERMNGRADVVNETGFGQLRRARPATNRVPRFDDAN